MVFAVLPMNGGTTMSYKLSSVALGMEEVGTDDRTLISPILCTQKHTFIFYYDYLSYLYQFQCFLSSHLLFSNQQLLPGLSQDQLSKHTSKQTSKQPSRNLKATLIQTSNSLRNNLKTNFKQPSNKPQTALLTNLKQT